MLEAATSRRKNNKKDVLSHVLDKQSKQEKTVRYMPIHTVRVCRGGGGRGGVHVTVSLL